MKYRYLTMCIIITMLLSCGSGTKVRIENHTEATIDQLFIETSQGRFDWNDVGVGKSVSKSIILEPGEIIEIGWTTAGRLITRNITMIDSIDRASKIEILLEGDTERLNISF